MEFSFKYQSDDIPSPDGLCTPLEVTVDVWCHDNDGDYGYNGFTVVNTLTGLEVAFDSLSDRDRTCIEKQVEETAYDNASEAYQDYIETQGDAAYDAWKERDRDE